MLALVVAGCGAREKAERAEGVEMAEKSAAVTGTVTYRERIMLPPSARLTVRLTDVSKQDIAGMVLAEQVISPVRVPAAFSLGYDPAAIDSTHTYVIQARIEDGGALQFVNMEQFQVLTRGSPRDSVEVLVKGVR
jgi:putative lipoprotein